MSKANEVSPSDEGADLMPLLYVTAGSHRQAMDYCRGKISALRQLRYIDSPHKIRGLRGIKLHAYGTYYENKFWHELKEDCQAREIEIVYV